MGIPARKGDNPLSDLLPSYAGLSTWNFHWLGRHDCSPDLSSNISMSECNTIVSAFTLYRQLQQYCIHPLSVSLGACWRGHQTSPTVVSLKGRLPQKLQPKSILYCEIVQITVCFVMVLYKNRNQNLTETENRRILFLCDEFKYGSWY